MTHQTQKQAILEIMDDGQWISTWSLVSCTGILCQTRRFTELRRDGHKIEKREKYVDGKRIVERRLVK